MERITEGEFQIGIFLLEFFDQGAIARLVHIVISGRAQFNAVGAVDADELEQRVKLSGAFEIIHMQQNLHDPDP
ncbi:hypothetical protein SDC9_102131 [bioreactor metagenome]|uniref:Uncharacterized protein n=1 Tax=bioreactor metagenome TaxID=1076179 RepID=A0A645AQK2_9ZZZZ